MITSDFLPWAGHLAQQLKRPRGDSVSTVHPLELLLSRWIPHWRLAQQDAGPHSRHRLWTLRLVFWTFLWQIAQARSSCREAIRQARALCLNSGKRPPPAADSPYCQARGALPLDRLQEVHDAVCREARAGLASKDLWCGREVLVADGSSVTAPDTPANQKAFPQQSTQQPGWLNVRNSRSTPSSGSRARFAATFGGANA